jgi:hypothetical protein
MQNVTTLLTPIRVSARLALSNNTLTQIYAQFLGALSMVCKADWSMIPFCTSAATPARSHV